MYVQGSVRRSCTVSHNSHPARPCSPATSPPRPTYTQSSCDSATGQQALRPVCSRLGRGPLLALFALLPRLPLHGLQIHPPIVRCCCMRRSDCACANRCILDPRDSHHSRCLPVVLHIVSVVDLLQVVLHCLDGLTLTPYGALVLLHCFEEVHVIGRLPQRIQQLRLRALQMNQLVLRRVDDVPYLELGYVLYRFIERRHAPLLAFRLFHSQRRIANWKPNETRVLQRFRLTPQHVRLSSLCLKN
mmetsp:Transcript_2471/g.5428  ORF Transcript_2471/g.5428 Transcript_2471/m.5428 type:complete len:245 (-) Transcript_2471:18-752(-)